MTRLCCLLALSLIACGSSTDEPPAAETTTGDETTGEMPAASESADSGDSAGTPATSGMTSDAMSSTDSGDSAAESSSEGSGGGPMVGPTTKPSSGQAVAPFWLDVTGRGSVFVGDINISNGSGTMEIRGEELPVVVHRYIDYTEDGYTRYMLLAVASDAWYRIILDCSVEGQVAAFGIGGTAGPRYTGESVNAACAGGEAQTVIEWDFPGTTFDVRYQGSQFAVEGPDVSLNAGETGRFLHNGVEYDAIPYDTIDPDLGWYQIDTLLWDRASSQVCSSVAYLIDGRQTIEFDFTVCLSSFGDDIGNPVVPATWDFG